MRGFKNALIPVLTLAGINLVVMLNAAVIIEVIFAWPGIGRLLYEGIFQRDFPLVQGIVMEAGIMIVVINLAGRHPVRLYRSAHPAYQVASHVNHPAESTFRLSAAIGCDARLADLPLLPLAILVPLRVHRGVRQLHRAVRSDRTYPRRQDLRAAVLV